MERQFDQKKNTEALATIQVVKKKLPILSVTHYSDDHIWAFTDGTSIDPKNIMMVSMEEILSRDNTLHSIADLPPGWSAIRKNVGGEWYRQIDNKLLKKSELFDCREHIAEKSAPKTITYQILKNVKTIKLIGWFLFPISAFAIVSEKGSHHLSANIFITTSIGALLNLIAIAGLILFITKEPFRNREFLSSLTPYFGCFLLWALFIGIFLFSQCN